MKFSKRQQEAWERSRKRGQFKKGDPRTVEMGKKGGAISKGGAFQKDSDFAREMGKIGGSRSKRTKTLAGLVYHELIEMRKEMRAAGKEITPIQPRRIPYKYYEKTW